jgi:CBS domain-containing protein
VEEQAREVEKVKKSESGMIIDPVTVSKDQRVSDVQTIMRNYKISGVPVLDGKKLVGIVTNRDLRFVSDGSLLVRDVMTSKNLVTAKVVGSLEGQGGKGLEDVRGVAIPVQVAGTFAKPTYKIRLDEALREVAEDKVKEKVQEKVEKKLEKQFGDSLKGLFNR